MKWYLKYPPWDEMSDDLKTQFVKESIEESHKEHYYLALKWAGVDGPKWEDLTEEQKNNVREENRRYQQKMNDFGNSLHEIFSE
jgi:hypothetical protein